MPLLYLYVLFHDGRMSRFVVKRFSDLFTDKSRFYYYEFYSDAPGKGTCIPRDSVRCVELSPFPVPHIEEMIAAQNNP